MARTDTLSVSINAKPDSVWEFVADLNNWKKFSDFGKNLEQLSAEEWVSHTSQGDVKVLTKFDKRQLSLDHVCVMPDDQEVFIPYRILKHGDTSELVMTNQQADGNSEQEYNEQLNWMRQELDTIKLLLEK